MIIINNGLIYFDLSSLINMNYIKHLDYALRDGGYYNNWDFLMKL